MDTQQKSSQKFFETHCHLDSIKGLSLEEALAEAESVGVDKFITVTTEVGNLSSLLDIAMSHHCVYTTQGIHPHDAKNFNSALIQNNLRLNNIHRANNCVNNKILAIGEIGLDYYYNFSSATEQRWAFEEQLKIASEYKLPVIIHSRDADQEMISILKNAAPSLQRKGVLHSYSSGVELAEMALSMGFYLGFNGMITFQKADNVRQIVEITPIERILLETDSPYLAPVPHRGKENHPVFLPIIAEKLCAIKKIPLDEGCQQIYQNSCHLFAVC
ncbi:MAG: TatD family hydrolase [Oligoflexia bacterium]|nr:TatD family hydrolase [Oligoflexia bacterium]